MKKNYDHISLGDRVKDKVTGFEGIATQRAENVDGSVRFIIEGPAGESGTGDILGVDWQLIEVIDKSVVSYDEPAVFDADFDLGDKLVDRTSGLKGIAVMKTYYLNGCVHFMISPKVKKFEDNPGNLGLSAPWQYFDLVEKNVFGLKTEGAKKAAERSSGGPSLRMKRSPISR